MSAATVTSQQETHTVNVRGEFLRLPMLVNCEACYEGPAGTAKTRTILEYIHLVLKTFPGARALFVRKRLVDLTASAVVTYTDEVLKPWDRVRWYGGSQREPPAFIYPNGSRIMLGGMDKPEKVKSRAFHLIYPNEATELEEGDLELLRSRLGRDERLPFWQLIMDANPTFPTHWLNQRMLVGRTVRLRTIHRDNPAFYDGAGGLTPTGDRYINGTLAGLTGVRYVRLALGEWCAAEGMVYQDSWDRARNVTDRATICARGSDLYGDCGVPRTWSRYLSVDFGYTHPFVLQWWAEDHDGRFYRYRELYMSHRLVEDHAREALRVMGYELVGGRPKAKSERSDPLPYAVYCDHDAEDRFTLERHMGLLTQPAYKAVSDGIQAVAARLRPAGDERPRLVLLRDSVVERDVLLSEAKQPTCTEDEIEGYVWNLGGGRNRGEEPVKEHDHGADAMRYLVATRDRVPSGVSYGPKLF